GGGAPLSRLRAGEALRRERRDRNRLAAGGLRPLRTVRGRPAAGLGPAALGVGVRLAALLLVALAGCSEAAPRHEAATQPATTTPRTTHTGCPAGERPSPTSAIAGSCCSRTHAASFASSAEAAPTTRRAASRARTATRRSPTAGCSSRRSGRPAGSTGSTHTA